MTELRFKPILLPAFGDVAMLLASILQWRAPRHPSKKSEAPQ